MRKLALIGLLSIFLFVLMGCGGQTGRNSPTQVRLETDAGTTDFAALHVIISPNSGSAVSLNAVSDIQAQSWATLTSGAGFKELSFITTSQQIPYFVYIQNTAGVQQTVRLRILMDGGEEVDRSVTVAATTTLQVETILRNNVQDP